ncbi:FAD-dependent monooxygenase [Ornithinimicrobium panacihumi]|uniref:FAD-dependent monooxygenase n=1 Tax=Ornithinimicrobium panacihumi TaxID=2008449 RepID=UPI003F8AD985
MDSVGSVASTVRPVLVIGAGPVGQTTALLLARYGIPVTVLDARPRRDPIGSKAICQQRDVLDTWAWCGAQAIADEGLTWTRARTFYRDQDLFAVDLPDPGASPLPPFVNISQSRTEEILDELLAAEPLVEVRWGHEVVEIRQDHAHDRVEVLARTDSGHVRLAARYAVAAAGARGSTIRTLLDVTFGGRTFEDSFLICDIRADLPGWEQERRFYFDPDWNRGRQVLIHPCPDSVYRIDWQLPADQDPTEVLDPDRLRTRIRQIIGAQDYELVWSSIYHFHARIASRFRVGRAFLAGDVAHLVAPFGARGLNSGVADADNLAWKLAAVLHGWAPDALLDSYETERMAAARENLAVTSATMDFLVPYDPSAVVRRRDLLERALHDPQARPMIDSGRLSEAFWYVDSPLTTPDPARAWPGRPPVGEPPAPVPGVSLPDALVSAPAGEDSPASPPDRRRLRELVRGRLTVVSDDAARGEAALSQLAEGLPEGTPVQHLDLGTLDGAGPAMTGLGWEPGDLWLVRPDAHTAARVREPGEVLAAARRMLALAPDGTTG